ncbi:MAG: C4-type zinc ribbon domain-containing protein [Myxococcota bacterium]|nr:C4-type zinc ribbon domain-containing protein [Myxococcota bacterium]
MALLDSLMELQDLDLQADRMAGQRDKLPEREALETCRANLEQNARLQASADARREELARSERSVAGEVSTVAAGAQDVESRLYSGSVTIPKELEALQEELRLTREKQAGLEESELEIMEQIEAEDTELGRLAEQRAETENRGEALAQAIHAAEEKIDGQLEALASQRQSPLAALPPAFADYYAALREKPRLVGRAAASLSDGLCQGCRVSMPRVDLSRILAEPEDALITCPHCTRLLVR